MLTVSTRSLATAIWVVAGLLMMGLSIAVSVPAVAVSGASKAAVNDEFPIVAGTWGGIVRSGPGKKHSNVASLKEGEEVVLMAPPNPDKDNGYPWFRISFRKGQEGYMWGGILCATGPERSDIYKKCKASRRSSEK